MKDDEIYARAIEDAVNAIDLFQDIVGWQPGESRNVLVCEIRERIRKLKFRSVAPASDKR